MQAAHTPYASVGSTHIGSASAFMSTFSNGAGFFFRLWQAGLAEYDGMESIAWRWQSIDGATHKASMAQECACYNAHIWLRSCLSACGNWGRNG